MRRGSRFFLIVWILAAMAVVVSCGGGGDEGGAQPQPPTYNLAGIWEVTETTGNNTCKDPIGISNSFIATIVHPDGSNSMTMTDIASSETVTLAVSGTSITYSETGTSTDCPNGFSRSWNFTAQSAVLINGTVSWSCQYAGGSCTGSDSVVALKQGNASVPLPTLTITGFTPTSGAVGGTVRITGTNFSTTPANNTVKFYNNVTALVTSSTSTSIMTTVPAGATTGPISVTVNGLTGTSATNFTVAGDAPAGVMAEVESNDSFDTAQTVYPGIVNGTTSGTNYTATYDNDWYKFTISSAKSYTITLTFDDTTDLDLYLVDSSSELIDLSTTVATGGSETITWTLTSGTYYVLVEPWATEGSEIYTLTID